VRIFEPFSFKFPWVARWDTSPFKKHIYNYTEQAINNINDYELHSMFTKVQGLDQADISCFKSLLNAYIMKKDLPQKLAE